MVKFYVKEDRAHMSFDKGELQELKNICDYITINIPPDRLRMKDIDRAHKMFILTDQLINWIDKNSEIEGQEDYEVEKKRISVADMGYNVNEKKEEEEEKSKNEATTTTSSSYPE